PAGPPGYPVIGNLFDWPFESGWLKFTDWSMSYGDIVHLQIFGVHIAILNSVDVTQALFTQAAYSDRPRLVMAGELMGFSPSIILAPYDEHWKSMRRLTRHYLSKTACQTFVPSQERDAKLLLRLLLEDPSNYRSAIHQYVSSIT
ncbi:cytochrome P450, partial [Stereum hirsutum FP-91666 SS1]|uniref:cytochrome P450 n=1 Tax=Stereum hirsutum (strain FP-91666) TaxID=721885 RepID=UPI0004449DB4